MLQLDYILEKPQSEDLIIITEGTLGAVNVAYKLHNICRKAKGQLTLS